MSANQNRITIQLDLNGYSFKIQDRSGSVIHEDRKSCPIDLAAGELVPALKSFAGAVSVYYATWKYVLVPVEYFDKSDYRSHLAGIRDISENDTVRTLDLPSRKAVMVYAFPSDVQASLSVLSKNIKFYPLTYLLIDRLASICDNNRLIAAFSDGVLHIVAGERDRLLFANSFPAGDIATAEYFIFSVCKEVFFNPGHTYVHIYGNAGAFMENELGKYFAGIRYLK